MEPKPTSPRFFAAHLQRRWAEGCHEGPPLLTEIRALGYRGCYSSLAKFLARWRDHALELQTKSRPLASVSLRQQAGAHPMVSGQISPNSRRGVVEQAPASAHGMAGGEVGGFEEGLPGFRPDAQLGDELSRHSAIREGGNAGALDEEGRRFRDLWEEAFCAEVKSRSGRGEERAQRKLEQRSGGGSHQSAEDPQAPDVWSSRLRTLTSPIAADVSWLPAAPKVRKNQIKDKFLLECPSILMNEKRQPGFASYSLTACVVNRLPSLT
jgi:hypothetical protein